MKSAPITLGLADTLAALSEHGHTMTVVSNNSQRAVQSFIDAHDLGPCIRGVVARTDPDPRLLKPSPHLVVTAMRQLDARPGECVLVGDSTTDVAAAHAAGTAAIGYANKPGKHERLATAGAEAIIARLIELAGAAAVARLR